MILSISISIQANYPALPQYRVLRLLRKMQQPRATGSCLDGRAWQPALKKIRRRFLQKNIVHHVGVSGVRSPASQACTEGSGDGGRQQSAFSMRVCSVS